MQSSDRCFHGWRMLRLGFAGLLAVLALGLAYKVKRVLRINLFPGIDMVPDEQLKAAVLWMLNLLPGPVRNLLSWAFPG